jgi:hypothetical protein
MVFIGRGRASPAPVGIKGGMPVTIVADLKGNLEQRADSGEQANGHVPYRDAGLGRTRSRIAQTASAFRSPQKKQLAALEVCLLLISRQILTPCDNFY